MNKYSQLCLMFFLLFIGLSMYLQCCTKKSDIFYAQIISGCGIFFTSEIGRNLLGLENSSTSKKKE